MKVTEETVCLVTGASSGIGRALAIAAAARGARLALVARREDSLRETARSVREHGGEALVLPCDVTDRAALVLAVERTIETYGRLDVLVNNAGRGHCAYVEDTPDAQIESMFRVNVFPLWYASAPAARQMRAQGRGLILTIASMAGKIGYPGNAAYVAAKHAAVGFTRALRTELAGSGVEAIVALPAGVATDWAIAAEGAPMLDLFAYESERGASIAAERGAPPAPAFALLSAEEAAALLLHAIENPAAEVYTHPGSRELALRYQEHQESAEAMLEPYWLANREGYERMIGGEGLRRTDQG